MSSSLGDLRQLLASTDGISKKLLLRDLHEIIVGAETPEETATRMYVKSSFGELYSDHIAHIL